ncbi:hypothetical protein LguiA_021776 [Lonicera macranthoides]
MESKKIVVEPPMSLSEEEIKQQSSSRKRKRNAGDLPHHQPETEEKNNNSSESLFINSVTKTTITITAASATTAASTITTTTENITVIIPPEDPYNQIHIYLCLGTHEHGRRGFTWFKIDPTNPTFLEEAPNESSSSSSSSYNNISSKANKKKKNKKKKNQSPYILLNPISRMPSTTGPDFIAVPQHVPSQNHKKLIYAFGTDALSGLKSLPGDCYSSKALVCDFATTSASPVWEELPTPFPSPITFFAGVASPLDGKVYAFGRLLSHPPNDCYSYTYRGLVFDPSSRSWTPCPAPTDLDYGYKSVAVVHNEHENPSTSRLVVFNYLRLPKAFNLATTQWENAFSHHPCPVRHRDDDDCDPTPTSVGVGNLIYRFTHRKLYVLDTSSPKISFKRVCGLNNKLPTYWETYGRPFLVYLGKGKLCIVWGCCSNSTEDARILHITCLKFWVGMDNRKNRLRAVIDRCDRFRAYGVKLYDVIAF